MDNRSILFEQGLCDFSVNSKEIYEKSYSLSNSKLSNSCFLHRICWNELFKYRYKVINSCFCLVADDNIINNAHIVYPLGRFSNSELREVLIYWRLIFKKYNKRFRIEFIDEFQLPRLGKCLNEEGLVWHLEECEGCWDYTYNKSDYLYLRGKKNRCKRHYWNHYLSNPSLYQLVKIGKNNIKECMNILNVWESQKELCKEELIGTDHYPLVYFFSNYDKIYNDGYILFRGGHAISFFVATIKGDCCFFHFAKCNRDYPAANYIMHKLFLDDEISHNIRILNFEDDMLNPEIRKYKANIADNVLVKKFAVEVE